MRTDSLTRIRRRTPRIPLERYPGHLHPVVRRLYASRGQAPEAAELRGLDGLPPPDGLPGMEAALDLLEQALVEARRILVVGDFDVDGATSTVLVLEALSAFGHRALDHLVPNRFDFGYGLSPELVEVAARRDPWLILTVDSGIACHDGVRAARGHGIRVLVTDHHLPGETLPPADAIVNPKLPGSRFPGRDLAGVGVAFYLMLALRRRLRSRGWFERTGICEPNLAELLDLVALGTVADVVPLDPVNRILVRQGLQRIRAGRCRPGIRALLAVANRDPRRVQARDLGFAVGPRLNAAGRLEGMDAGIACLCADSEDRARELAARLDALNRQRREIEAAMCREAETLLDLPGLGDESLPWGLVLFEPGWHAGVIGILAARIKDRWHRPVIALADAGDGMLKGSARSIPGFHVRDAIENIEARHPGLVPRFGGHAMAAGLTLASADLDVFRAAFDEEVRRCLAPSQLEGVIETDGELAPEYCNIELVESLDAAGPWGQGFPEPCFDDLFRVRSARIVGERHLKMQVQHNQGGSRLDAIAFFQGEALELARNGMVRLVYRPDLNEYLGRRSLQLIVERVLPEEAPVIEA